jgi:hypothetical protein
VRELNRFSLVPIVTRHYRGLVAPGKTRLSIASIAAFFLLPLAVAGAGWALGFSLPSTAIGPLLTGTGLLCGAFLSVFVLLTNLRIKVDETEKWSYKTTLIKVIANTAASTLYASSVAFGVVGSLVVAVSIPRDWVQVLHAPGSAVIAALAVHLLACFLVVVRRLYGVYFAMFKRDFDPLLQIVSSTDRRNSA